MKRAEMIERLAAHLAAEMAHPDFDADLYVGAATDWAAHELSGWRRLSDDDKIDVFTTAEEVALETLEERRIPT